MKNYLILALLLLALAAGLSFADEIKLSTIVSAPPGSTKPVLKVLKGALGNTYQALPDASIPDSDLLIENCMGIGTQYIQYNSNDGNPPGNIRDASNNGIQVGLQVSGSLDNCIYIHDSKHSGSSSVTLGTNRGTDSRGPDPFLNLSTGAADDLNWYITSDYKGDYLQFDKKGSSCPNPSAPLTITNDNTSMVINGCVPATNPSTGSAYYLTVNGDAFYNGYGTGVNTVYWPENPLAPAPSDRRFKKNIEKLTGVNKKLENINGVRFDWRADKFPEKNFSGRRQIGLIAQEVEKVYPELVTTITGGEKVLVYDKVSAVLLEATKENIADNKKQLGDIDFLKKDIVELKSMVKK